MTRRCWAWRPSSRPRRQRGAGAVRRPELRAADGDGDPVACAGRGPTRSVLVVATPAVGLATAKARAALARSRLARKDAIFNLQRVLSLVHALQHREYDRAARGGAGTAGISRRARRSCRCSARCWRWTIPMCSARSCRARVRRWRCWPAGTLARVEQMLATLYARAGVRRDGSDAWRASVTGATARGVGCLRMGERV